MLVRSLHAYWSLWLNGVNFNSKQVQGRFIEEYSRRSIRIFIFICQIGAFQVAHYLYDMTESYVDFFYLFVLMQEQPDMSSSIQAKQKLEGLLNKNMRIRMTDGRTLVGLFLCTDRDCNVILGSAQEFLKSTGWINTAVLSSIYQR